MSRKVKNKGKVVPVKHHAMKIYSGSGGIAPRILDVGTSRNKIYSGTAAAVFSVQLTVQQKN
jgi:hypothetical protein